jgi:hypothetical protein
VPALPTEQALVPAGRNEMYTQIISEHRISPVRAGEPVTDEGRARSA